jgi:hypothetical protein
MGWYGVDQKMSIAPFRRTTLFTPKGGATNGSW